MTGDLPTGHDVGDLVRLDRYPVHAPSSEGYAILVTDCRRRIDDIGCCTLQGFLTGNGLQAMREDSIRVAPSAYHSKQWTNVYFGLDDEDLPKRHPIRRFFDRTSAFVPADQFSETSTIRALYEWPGLMPFFQPALPRWLCSLTTGHYDSCIRIIMLEVDLGC
jgi:hypothetical protein